MTTNELVRKIDETIGMGMAILADHVDEGTGRTESTGRIKEFCQGVKALIEDIYGGDNLLPGKFEGSKGYDRELLEDGLAVLKDLRTLTVYSGEFSS